ncbi:MAG: SDR family NAD(P)-dependent oxidoreductase [Desulfobacterales bacterium]
MRETVLITGGGGFIGSHLCDELISHGYAVRVIDCLSEQVHGKRQTAPDYLNPEAEFIYGDIRDAELLEQALKGVDAVFHLAAAVGVGQSMYQPDHYTSCNNLGTAVLLKQLMKNPVKKFVVASSMSIYGEGLYRTQNGNHALVNDCERKPDHLRNGIWEPRDTDGNRLEPLPTPETKSPSLASVYALSKYDQECMSLMIGRSYGIPTIALRFFNVYGPRQALSNPYTGVMAIFAARYLNGKPPLIFEDGAQMRDFVSVYDVAAACRLALEAPASTEGVFNIGSGSARTILSIAEDMAEILGREAIRPMITRKYRTGDIRHCFADIGRAEKMLGYQPGVMFGKGLRDYSDWLKGRIAEDRVETAASELASYGLTL